MSVTVRGIDVVLENMQRYSAEVRQAVVDANNATAQMVRTTAIKKIQRSPGTGRVYEKTNPNRIHRASSPGNPPRTDTGRLVGAIRAVLGRRQSPAARVGVEYGVDYGFWLEFGTINMAARPFLIPSLKENEDFYRRMLRRKVTEALK